MARGAVEPPRDAHARGRTRPPHAPWLFLFLDLPFGAAVGYAMIAMPFWLVHGGVPLDQVGAISAAVFAPHAFKILLGPGDRHGPGSASGTSP